MRTRMAWKLIFLLSLPLFTLQAKDAKVVILKGTAKYQNMDGETMNVTKGMWIPKGSTIMTTEKSMVRMVLRDKTQINLGPKSQMKIDGLRNGNNPGVISVIKGQIRSKVDPGRKLASNGNAKAKYIIRTRSASMGIRGTDFHVMYNPQNNVSSLITYTGEVAMVKANGLSSSTSQLAAAVNGPRVQLVKKGQFAGINPQTNNVTVPVKMSPAQFEAMKSNNTLINGGGQVVKASTKSIVPPGLSSKLAGNNSAELEGQVANVVGRSTVNNIVAADSTNVAPEGFYNKSTGQLAPPAGGYVDPKTGLYIAPPPGSTYDATAGVYVPPANYGGFDATSGEYVAPEGITLTDEGKFVLTDSSLASGEAIPQMVQPESVGEDAFAAADNGIVSSDRNLASSSQDGGSILLIPPVLLHELQEIEDGLQDSLQSITPSNTRVNVNISVN